MQQTVIPQLRMTDATVSVPFYQRLGFAIDWEHRFAPDMPLFVQISREGQSVFLSEHAGDCEPGGAVYFRVPDVDALHAAFVAAGAPVFRPPADVPWGGREMMVVDPDHNRLRFATQGD
ncbi:VOC family protein [Stenotrophomonas sp.]|uniref:bleomycin resistance protein n=1 Tax=Stenotrophomonas sp. TaxID=69392 RepID=UPI0029B5DC8D|nr:VOC family protein [Stenotrophomonas sp.]MDX3934461.1 VOC family protein [Stenotrophomonas sp.]